METTENHSHKGPGDGDFIDYRDLLNTPVRDKSYYITASDNVQVMSEVEATATGSNDYIYSTKEIVAYRVPTSSKPSTIRVKAWLKCSASGRYATIYHGSQSAKHTVTTTYAEYYTDFPYVPGDTCKISHSLGSGMTGYAKNFSISYDIITTEDNEVITD